MSYEQMNGHEHWLRSASNIVVHLAETSGRHTAQIEHLTIRVSKLEERHQIRRIPWGDLAPILYGLLIAGLVIAGKLTLSEALLMARGG